MYKPLTKEQYESLKPGDKLVRLNGAFNGVKQGDIITVLELTDGYHIKIKENPLSGGHFYKNLALAHTLKQRLINKANEGRRAADLLLKRYPDQIETKNGFYVDKDDNS